MHTKGLGLLVSREGNYTRVCLMKRKTTSIYKPKLCLVSAGDIILLLAAGAVMGVLVYSIFLFLFTL